MKNHFCGALSCPTNSSNNKVTHKKGRSSFTFLKTFSILLINSAVVISISAQPNIAWQKCLGGNYSESANDSKPTFDGGLIMVGYTFSTNNGDVSGGYGNGDFWIVKTDSLANIEWQKAQGGSSTEVAYAVVQANDGGYLVAGNTYSNDGDITNYHGAQDIWVVRLDAFGEIVWKRTLGGSKDDGVRSVCLASDGGFIVAGSTVSTDGDALSQGHALSEVWVVKLNDSGNIDWEWKYGGSDAEEAFKIVPTVDGGYVFVGKTFSNNGDVFGNQGNVDYWVVKIDQNGVIQWQKPLGGIGADSARDIQPTSDGGYVIAGIGAGPINSGQFTDGKGGFDFWVVKLNGVGELLWQKALGGSKSDLAFSIKQTMDDGFIVAGNTQSLDGDVQGNLDYLAGWVVKLDPNGSLQWQKALGGADIDQFFNIYLTSDGGYLATGETMSIDGDVSGNHGLNDFWVVKLSPESTPTYSPSTQALTLSPNPAQNTLSIQTQEAGKTEVQIYNLLGEVLQQQRLEMSDLGTAQVDISQLPTGLYLITATAASGQMYTGRFCKQE